MVKRTKKRLAAKLTCGVFTKKDRRRMLNTPASLFLLRPCISVYRSTSQQNKDYLGYI